MNIISKVLFLSLLVGAIVSCKGDITDINHNPNALEYGTVNPENLMDDLIYNASRVQTSQTFATQGDLIQYCVRNSTSLSVNHYNISTSLVYNIWNNLYRWTTEAHHMKERSVETGNKAAEAIAIIMESLLIQNITDIYGDVPYSDAFKTYSGVTKPKFDTQQQIYRALESNLRYANEILASDVAISNTAKDKLYGGDMTLWRKFANSLLLRVLMRQSNRDDQLGISGKIAAVFNDKNTYPVFENVKESAVLYYDAVEPFVNYYGTSTTFGDSYKASEFMIGYMLEKSDPRIGLYYEKDGNDWKGGVSGGYHSDGSMVGASMLNQPVLGDFSSPFSFIRYDEVLFIKAEAAQRGWIDSSKAADLYRDANIASLDYWQVVSGKTISDADRNAYLKSISYDGTYRQLITQKFVALFGVGYEGWDEYRRTGFPELKIGPATMNDHILPKRFMYPLQESANNPDSYLWALDRLINYYKGGDDMKTVVWWSAEAVKMGIE